MRSRTAVVFGAVIALLAGLTGCAKSTSTPGTGGKIQVVAAENFYGDIVSQLGGDHVQVVSILSDPSADPHLYEPGTANAAAVAHASLVIESGLGYDAFMDRLLAASPNSGRSVVTIADALHISGADANPHIWYDVPQVPLIAKTISDSLIKIDPANRSYYQDHLAAFDASLKPLNNAVAAIKSSYAGQPVAYTEPVPGYMLAAAGLVVQTPADFARAIEEGNEPTAQSVAAMEALLTNKQVQVLLYNSQATSPVTDRMRQIAQQHGIPIVPVSETLPPNMTFQQWQLSQVQALLQALGG